MAHRRLDQVRRVAWAGIAQTASSGTNFAVGVLVARAVSPVGFGSFGLAIAILTIAMTVVRGAASQALLLKPMPEPSDSANALGFAFVSGIPIGALIAIGGLLTAGPVRGCLLTVAPFVPIFLYQDTLRYVYFNIGAAKRVAVMDSTWGICSAAALVTVTALSRLSPETGLALWGLGAGLSIFVGLGRAAPPTLRRARAWIPELHGDAGKLALDGMIAVSSGSLAQVFLSGFASVKAVASFRGARTLLNPTQLLVASVETVIIPAVARTGGVRGAWRAGRAFSVVAAPALCFLGLALGFLPDSVGRGILGRTWAGAAPVLLPLGAALGASMAWSGAELFLRVAGRIGITVRVRIVGGIATVLATCVAGAIGGALGAAWAALAVNAVAAGTLWAIGHRVLRLAESPTMSLIGAVDAPHA